MINKLFTAIDNKDADAFGEFLAEGCTFRFANQQPVKGRPQVVEYVKGFFASIKDLEHELVDVWELENDIICHGMVTYIRHNGSSLNVPFANVFKMDGEKVRDYLIFVDTSALYAE